MLQALVYDSSAEANNRLAGTVVTYAGEPVLIERVEDHADGVLRVLFRAFPYGGSVVRKKINSPQFRRFATIPLGFANYFRGEDPNCVWCEREAARTRRQGMSSETFRGSRLQSGERVDWERLSRADAFREMVVGEYPSYEDAVARLVPNSSIAVDRLFAVSKTPGSYVHLYHRRDEVGIIVRDNLYLRGDRQHLIEEIRDNGRLPNRIEVM